MSRISLVVVITCLVMMGAPQLFAQANPFVRGSLPDQGAPILSLPSILPLPDSYREVQRDIYEGLHGLVQTASSKPTSLLLLVGLALLYGIFHSLLPGHQKVVVTSFFLASDAKPRDSLTTAGLFTLFHTLSSLAIVLVVHGVSLVGAWVLGYAAGLDAVSAVSTGLAALASIVLGVYLLVGKIHMVKELRRRANLAKVQNLLGIEYPPFSGHGQIMGKKRRRRFFGMLATASLVPCPGTLMVLTASLALGALWVGVLASFFISLGVGLVLLVLAFLTISLKNVTRGLKTGFTWEALGITAESIAALLIIVTGLFMIL